VSHRSTKQDAHVQSRSWQSRAFGLGSSDVECYRSGRGGAGESDLGELGVGAGLESYSRGERSFLFPEIIRLRADSDTRFPFSLILESFSIIFSVLMVELL
jgi:hypothetical protein